MRASISFAFASVLALAGCSSTAESSRADAGPPHKEDAGTREDGSFVDGGAPTTADASGPIAAAMNDVSVLFPLPSKQAEIDDLLAASASGDRGVLLPSPLYASTGGITGSTFFPDGGANELAAYGDLRVVAARLDPCFASLDPDPHGVGCTAQLRVIFQEVTWQSDGMGGHFATAFDSALHAFYDLTRGELLALASALVALRVANVDGEKLGPLAPHPIIAHQGLAGPMSQGVEHLILEYAGSKNLVRLAQFGTQNNELEEIWNLSAFDVDATKTVATPRIIPTLEGDGGVRTEGVGGGASAVVPDASIPVLFAQFTATTAKDDDFAPLDDRKPESLTETQRQAAFDAIARVENPKDNSPNTIDCARCHLATPTEKLVAFPLFGFVDTKSPLAFQPEGTSVTASDLTPTFAPSDGQFNIHAFSYFGTQAGINQRVVNETAAVVEYLNALPK